MKDKILQALPAPLLLPVLFWCLGIVLARAFPGQFYVLGLGVVAMLGAWFLPRVRVYLLLLLVVVLGYQRFEQQAVPQSAFDQIFTAKNHIRQSLAFEVHSVVSSEFGSYKVRVDSLAGIPLSESILLSSDQALEVGTAYRAVADVMPLRSDDVLDDGFRRYPAKAYVVGSVIVTDNRGGWNYRCLRVLPKLRHSLLMMADRKIGEHSGLAKALLLSDSSAKYEMRDRLTRGGMIHLVVVSGLHVWFIYLILMVIFNLFLPRRISELLFLIVALCFTVLNNWSPSIVRAMLMIATFIVSRWFSRPVSKLQLLALSLFIITVIAPRQLFSIGLQLSYICVGIILFALPRVHLWSVEQLAKSRVKQFIDIQLNYIILSLLVSIGIFPITLYYFNQASLNGIIGNILGIPLIGLLLPLSFILMVLPSGNAVFEAFHRSYEWILMLFDRWVDFCASLPLYFDRIYFSVTALVITILTIVLMYMALNRKWRLLRRALVPAALVTVIVIIAPLLWHHKAFRVIVFNAGLADCSLVTLPSGQNIMIDTGVGWLADSSRPDISKGVVVQESWMQKKLLRWLIRNHVKQIDWLILTHLHIDHYGGFPVLVTTLSVKNIAVTDETVRSGIWQSWERQGYLAHSTVHVISDTISYYIGPTRLQFLHPDKGYYSAKENNRSLVMRLFNGSERYLFTGDIEKDAEDYLLAHYPEELSAQYVKIPHHGSKDSSSELFLQTVHPSEAWISTSSHNRYGFPHIQTLDRLNKYHILYRITSNGSIVHQEKKD